jgi:hypothetical protein
MNIEAKAQVAKLSPVEQKAYFKYRRLAIIFSCLLLWTFPAFSFPTIFNVVVSLNGGDAKLAMLQTTFSSGLPLAVGAIVFLKVSQHYRREAQRLRTGVTLP